MNAWERRELRYNGSPGELGAKDARVGRGVPAEPSAIVRSKLESFTHRPVNG